MYYSDEIIDEVRSRSNIVEVIGERIHLTKKGTSYVGLCPFHSDKNPSFSVSEPRQIYRCFSCGEGGNVFGFVMKYDSLTFPEAVKVLADRAGVELPETEYSAAEKRKTDLKNTILEINTEAARYYHSLLSSPAGANAKAYFEKRELKPETITAFGLGVSGMKSDDLYRYMKKKGYSDQILKETGLFVYSERGVYDEFRNRVMFPIMNMNRKVIGFGGRVMGDAKPKYLNTRETPVFEKRRNLFGLHVAKNSRKGNMIICEGYMDVIAMHQAGFTQAVASLGTALTPEQIMLMKRYVKNILVCYDSDEAGVKAALKAIDLCKQAGLTCKVIDMRPYKDADEFIKAKGAEAFQERIDNAENNFLFTIRQMERDYDMSDPTTRTNFFHAVGRRLLEFPEELERNNYRDAIAAQYQISVNGLQQIIERLAADGVMPIATPKVSQPKNQEKDNGLKHAQRMLLTWIADEPNIYGKVKLYIQEEDFTEPFYREVAKSMFESLETGKFSPAALMDRFAEDERYAELAKIFSTDLLDDNADLKDKERALNEAVILIKRNSLEEKSKTAPDMVTLQQVIKEQANLRNIHISLT